MHNSCGCHRRLAPDGALSTVSPEQAAQLGHEEESWAEKSQEGVGDAEGPDGILEAREALLQAQFAEE